VAFVFAEIALTRDTVQVGSMPDLCDLSAVAPKTMARPMQIAPRQGVRLFPCSLPKFSFFA
jgi:hypothetical protein